MFKMSASTPIVTVSEHVMSGTVIVIEASQFEDGKTRVAVPSNTAANTCDALEQVLQEMDAIKMREAWLNNLLKGENR